MKPRRPPLAPGLPLLGSLFPLVRNPTEFLVENYFRLGSIFRVHVANRRFVVVAGPEANVFFMRGPGAQSLVSRKVYQPMVDDTGSQHMIVSNDGERHRYVRRLLRPAYSREMLDQHLPRLGEVVETL